MGGDSDWRQVSTAWGHTVALKQNGTLWGWGSNRNGQLGQPEADFLTAPVQIGNATNWTLVTIGPGNTLAANRDAEVWEWGWVGQPPRGTDTDARRQWAPERIASGINWQRLFSTTGENLGLSTLGELWILRQWSWVLHGKQEFPVRWEGSTVRDTVLGSGHSWSIDEQGHLRRWNLGRGPRVLRV